MYPNESIHKIMAVYRRCGEAQFRMALQYLLDTGKNQFTANYVAAAKAAIRKSTPKNAILTAGYQEELVDISCELSQLPLWDILLFVKLYIHIQNDDLLQLEEADAALSSWHDLMAPKAWTKAVADPDLREEILRAMVEKHDPEYTSTEIQNAIRQVAEAL